MEPVKESNISYDEIIDVLRNVIKQDDLSKTSLDDLREVLSNHFQKPKTFFDKCKNEVNQLIVETLKDMYTKESMKPEIKTEEPPATEKRPSVTSAPASTEASPKRTKQLQADIMTRSEFLEKAPEIKVQIADASFTVSPKKFSTDSCGWYGSEKIKIQVDGKTFVCQVGLNCTVVGSKQWKP